MTSMIDTLRTEHETHAQTARTILEKYAPDQEVSDADQANLTDLKGRMGLLAARIEQLAELDTNSAELDALMGRRAQAGAQRFPGVEVPETGLGSAFLSSSEFARWKSAGADGSMAEVTAEFTLVTSKDGAGEPIGGEARVRDAGLPTLTTPVLNSFTVETTDQTNVWWLEYPEYAPEAGVVAEGQPMGEAAYQPKVVKAAADSWKHSLPVSEEALADERRLQSMIEGALVRGVRKKAEKSAGQLVAGLAGTRTATADNLTAGIRYGIAELQDDEEGYLPSHVYLNAYDFADLDLALLERTLNGAVRGSAPWGLSYVVSPAFTPGTLFVADAAAAFLFIDRAQVRLAMTDSHADEFVEDVYRLKATGRGKAVCQRPRAVVKVTASAAVAASPAPAPAPAPKGK